MIPLLPVEFVAPWVLLRPGIGSLDAGNTTPRLPIGARLASPPDHPCSSILVNRLTELQDTYKLATIGQPVDIFG